MIELKNISKTYGKGEGAVHALRGVSLTIEDSKFVAIVGKSGSGKSTMMNIIGALDSPTEGEVIADNVNITRLNDDRLAEYRNKHIGYIFQSFYLEPTFTVLENVAMPLTIAGMDKSKRERLAKDAIDQLGLSDKTHKKASELSGGQKQRVSIARAIVHQPKIILADEPTGNLDSHNGLEVLKLLQKIADSGKTVVLVTHNIEDARKTDTMVELKDGLVERITHNTAEQKAKALKQLSDYDDKGNLKHYKEESKSEPVAAAEEIIEEADEKSSKVKQESSKSESSRREPISVAEMARIERERRKAAEAAEAAEGKR